MNIEENIFKVTSAIEELLENKDRITVAIDGRCASGKTTLACEIAKRLDCNIFHMDDFFLRPEQRSAERLSKAGENVDHERFLSEVLIPLSRGEAFSYRPFDCHTMSLLQPIAVEPKRIAVVEGSYSCHPSLYDYYDLRIFSDVSPEEQMKRITARNGKAGAERFASLWIPLEEKYFDFYDVANKCHMVLGFKF